MFPVNLLGLDFICRMCEHMAKAIDRGLDTCGQDCGGLQFGRAFPKYKGPLEKLFVQYCHRCGDPSEKILEVDKDGRLGICDSCLEKFLDSEGVEE